MALIKTKNNANSDNDVKDGKKLAPGGGWRKVSVSDSRQCNYRKIDAIDPGPTLQIMINHTTNSNYNTGGNEKVAVLLIA